MAQLVQCPAFLPPWARSLPTCLQFPLRLPSRLLSWLLQLLHMQPLGALPQLQQMLLLQLQLLHLTPWLPPLLLPLHLWRMALLVLMLLLHPALWHLRATLQQRVAERSVCGMMTRGVLSGRLLGYK
jgi:hypothetical protein